MPAAFQRSQSAYFFLLCVLQVFVTVHVHRCLLRRVEDVAQCLLVSNEAVMVAAVGGQENRLSLFIMTGDVPHRSAKSRCREPMGDVASTAKEHKGVIG